METIAGPRNRALLSGDRQNSKRRWDWWWRSDWSGGASSWGDPREPPERSFPIRRGGTIQQPQLLRH